RWGVFPALSLGWNIHNEGFMANQDIFTNLKLRAGYGETGNEGFAPGVATRMYGSDTWWLMNGQWRRTYGVAHNQNTDLKWETKKEYNIGVDFRSEEHTSELQSRENLVCRLLLEKKKKL